MRRAESSLHLFFVYGCLFAGEPKRLGDRPLLFLTERQCWTASRIQGWWLGDMLAARWLPLCCNQKR